MVEEPTREFEMPPYDPKKDPEKDIQTVILPGDEKKVKKNIKKVLLWIIILAVIICLILWALHSWLGVWIVLIHEKYDCMDKQCEWMAEKLPLWLVGNEAKKEIQEARALLKTTTNQKEEKQN